MTTTEPYAALEVPPAGRAIDVRRQPVGTGLPTPVRGGYWQSVLRFGLAGNTVEPLIDGRPAFAAMQRAIESAQTGGYQGPGDKSVIPAVARAKLGVRLVPSPCRSAWAEPSPPSPSSRRCWGSIPS